MNTYKDGIVKANGINYSYIEKGEGELLLCLHGFPDHALSFHNQLEFFSANGYRVVAPYMRGYSPTEIPADLSYHTAILGNDVLDIIESLGYKSATLIGHDWGGAAANAAAIINPERVEKLITVSIARVSFQKSLISDPVQQKRSWYMFFFLPAFAEYAVQFNDYAFLEMLWNDWSSSKWDFKNEFDLVKETFKKPGVLSAALNYYRCMFDPAKQNPDFSEIQQRIAFGKISAPSLHIHGKEDNCMGVELCDGMEAFFAGSFKKVIIPDAGHFVHIQKADEFNRTVLEFLKEVR